MRILVIGGTGVLGSRLCNYFKLKKIDYYFTSRKKLNFKRHRKLNLLNTKNIKNIIYKIKPTSIINCSGLTNTDLCNRNYKLAFMQNVKSVENLIKVLKSLKSNSHLIHISSDQIYFGKDINKNIESDVRTSNNYSVTKYLGEKKAIEYKNLTIIRTNFFGQSYSKKKPSFSEFLIKNLINKKKIEVAKNIFFSPVGLTYLSNIIFKIIKKNLYGTYNLGSKDKISKYEFVLKIINYKKIKNQNISIFFSKYKKNLRPLNTALSSQKIMKKLNIKCLSINEMLKIEH